MKLSNSLIHFLLFRFLLHYNNNFSDKILFLHYLQFRQLHILFIYFKYLQCYKEI